MLGKYYDLFDTIEDKNLRVKLSKLEEMKNKMYSETNKHIFKIGFSIATKMLIEKMTCEL